MQLTLKPIGFSKTCSICKNTMIHESTIHKTWTFSDPSLNFWINGGKKQPFSAILLAKLSSHLSDAMAFSAITAFIHFVASTIPLIIGLS
jgi:hypothetical protein